MSLYACIVAIKEAKEDSIYRYRSNKILIFQQLAVFRIRSRIIEYFLYQKSRDFQRFNLNYSKIFKLFQNLDRTTFQGQCRNWDFHPECERGNQVDVQYCLLFLWVSADGNKLCTEIFHLRSLMR